MLFIKYLLRLANWRKETNMDFFTENAEVLVPVVFLILDIAMGAISNSKIKYKGLILQLFVMIGKAAGKVSDYDAKK